MQRTWTLRILAAVLLWAVIRLNFGMIEHYDFDIFSVDGDWPKVLEVVGNIAAGN